MRYNIGNGFIEQLLLVIQYGGIILGIFVVLLLNNKRVKKSRANIFLSVLLIALSFSILHNTFGGQVLRQFHYRSFTRTPIDPSFLLIGPALWFYIKELTGSPVRFSFKLLLHFLPFILVVCVFFIVNSRDSYKYGMLFYYMRSRHQPMAIFFWTSTVVQLSVYQFYIYRKWRTYQQLMVQEVSNTENVNISWVNFFIGVFLVINLVFLYSLVEAIHADRSGWLLKLMAVVFSLSVFALGYKGILQKDIFHTGSKEPPSPAEGSSSKGEPLRQLADDPPLKTIHTDLMHRLQTYMEEKQPYLDPELTLSELAKQLNMSRGQLSQLINEGTGDNFYNFINKYRVEQVKLFMLDPAMKHYSMLGIALEAGFKSKSTFNLIFKRFTGVTPTEYRKHLES
jgi:AraC-like DNA-binding protein